MSRSSAHLHGNVLAAVDVETTGLDPENHEIWQIAILPLDSNITPSKTQDPFYMDLKITDFSKREKNALSVSPIDFAERQLKALDPYTVADLLEEWYIRLNLPVGRRLVPLAHNWPFDRHFIIKWIGTLSFEFIFHPHYRDSMAAAMFIKDRCDWKSEPQPFKRASLSQLCMDFGVNNLRPHDALQDCMATAEVYRRLLKYHLP